MKNGKYVGFIPARSGSTRLKDKNILPLGGKPLIAWTLEAFQNVNRIHEIVFSTDSMEYWEMAQKYVEPERLRLDFRNPEEAGSSVKIFDYLKANIDQILGGKPADIIMGLPTVPFRTADHINQAIDLYEVKLKPVFSACSYEFPIAFSFSVNEEGEWDPLFPGSPMVSGNTQSQHQQVAYHPNGAIYVRNSETLLSGNLNTLYDGALPYFMDRNVSVDIDDKSDFDLASAMVQPESADRQSSE